MKAPRPSLKVSHSFQIIFTDDYCHQNLLKIYGIFLSISLRYFRYEGILIELQGTNVTHVATSEGEDGNTERPAPR